MKSKIFGLRIVQEPLENRYPRSVLQTQAHRYGEPKINALSFYLTKTVLVGPKWFWSDQIDLDLTIIIWSWPNEMVTTKMNWSGPNVIHFGRKSQFGPDQFILVKTISFWSRPNHYGEVQINLVRPKPFGTDQNCFGHKEGQGISIEEWRPYLRVW